MKMKKIASVVAAGVMAMGRVGLLGKLTDNLYHHLVVTIR